jgi:hypothetical protein
VTSAGSRPGAATELINALLRASEYRPLDGSVKLDAEGIARANPSSISARAEVGPSLPRRDPPSD